MFKKTRALKIALTVCDTTISGLQKQALGRALSEIQRKASRDDWRASSPELIAAILLRSAVRQRIIDPRQLSAEGYLAIECVDEGQDNARY